MSVGSARGIRYGRPPRETPGNKRKGIDGRAHKEWNLRLNSRPQESKRTFSVSIQQGNPLENAANTRILVKDTKKEQTRVTTRVSYPGY